jgi:uncharacterized membrane protein
MHVRAVVLITSYILCVTGVSMGAELSSIVFGGCTRLGSCMECL